MYVDYWPFNVAYWHFNVDYWPINEPYTNIWTKLRLETLRINLKYVDHWSFNVDYWSINEPHKRIHVYEFNYTQNFYDNLLLNAYVSSRLQKLWACTVWSGHVGKWILVQIYLTAYAFFLNLWTTGNSVICVVLSELDKPNSSHTRWLDKELNHSLFPPKISSFRYLQIKRE